MTNWLLPEYIQDMLPDEAWRIEQMRSQFLSLMKRTGYQLVAPPLIEYQESLLIDDSDDMDLRTFKLVDQLSGRSLALRADITPQAARIDAHILNKQGVTRLCYAGNVVHTQPAGLTSSRELLQIGAELYGHCGIESDIEIQRLLLETLNLLGVTDIHLDIGHVAVFRALVAHAELSAEVEQQLFQALQGKDSATLAVLVADLPSALQQAFMALPTLYGAPQQVIARARQQLPDAPEINQALQALQDIAAELSAVQANISIDLSDLRGYHYHNGFIFAVYHPGSHDAIALGGRYDGLGESFGRARAATGFSMDLRQLYRLLPQQQVASSGVCAPSDLKDAALQQKISQLRADGEVVVVDLLGDAALRKELPCDRELVWRDGEWQVTAL